MNDIESKIRIRPMEPEDIAGVLDVDRRLSGSQRAVTYTDLITGDLGGVLDLSFVAEVRGRVTAFVLARHAYLGDPVTEVGLIQIIGVDPTYQHQNIASKLIQALVERCKTKGIKTIRAMVNDSDSQLAGFFSSLGFRRGELIDYTIHV